MNLVIRHAEPDDYLGVARIYEYPLAAAGTFQIPLQSTEVWKKRLAGMGPLDRVLVAVADGEIVGNLGLHQAPHARRAHVAHFGIAVRDDWHGKGIGKTLLRSAVDLADNWLGLIRLELTVWTDNTVAQRLYASEGFVAEGTHRAYALRHGRYTDALAMARLNPTPPRL
ncbi:MAG: GNAT family N-acetyltransferase [Burkholderiales bacterium PBB3]|nr:MAG: GNAT family N-acetyltransferase [Burkholderiales bacterium PBB3]